MLACAQCSCNIILTDVRPATVKYVQSVRIITLDKMASSFAGASKWMKLRKTVSILVCGRTGVGKSALINFILGEGVCEVSHQGSDREGIHTVVQKPTVTIYETSDSSPANAGELYMKYKEVDLVIYCQRMIDVRLDLPPPETLTFLRALTGGGFLGKTVLVLTKANLVEPFGAREDGVKYFRGVYSAMTTMIRSEVAKASRDGPPVTPPPAVPVGSARHPITLPDGKHFMGNLCVSCLECLPHEKHKVFIQAINFAERLIMSYRSPSPEESLGEHIRTMSLSDGKDPPYPIYMDEEDSERLRARGLGIEVCKFRYAGCMKVLPHKEMEDHLKKDSTAHIEILGKQLQSMYQQNIELREEVAERDMYN